MSDTRPMTPEQAAMLKELAKAAYELDAFKPNLRRAEAELRIAMLTAKLKLLRRIRSETRLISFRERAERRRRGPAHRRQHRQAARAVEAVLARLRRGTGY
jgi:hypothetical protein